MKQELTQTMHLGLFSWILDKVNSWHDYFIFKQWLTVSEGALLLASVLGFIWASFFGIYIIRVTCETCGGSAMFWTIGVGLTSALHLVALFITSQWPRTIACGLHGFFWAMIFVASVILLPETFVTPLTFVVFILGTISFAKMLAGIIKPQTLLRDV